MSHSTDTARLIVEGFVLGWSVAWPPGPINAEMIRRGITGHQRSGIAVGLGASTGDFLWALVVASGLGALATVPIVRPVLTVVSFVLLLLLAWVFLKGAFKSWEAMKRGTFHEMTASGKPTTAGGYLLGLTLALTSPWNIAFWLAVLGNGSGASPATTQAAATVVQTLGLGPALTKAAAVVGGALTWCMVLALALRLGARFATPTWDITTRALTGLLMLYFAGRLIWRVVGGA